MYRSLSPYRRLKASPTQSASSKHRAEPPTAYPKMPRYSYARNTPDMSNASCRNAHQQLQPLLPPQQQHRQHHKADEENQAGQQEEVSGDSLSADQSSAHGRFVIFRQEKHPSQRNHFSGGDTHHRPDTVGPPVHIPIYKDAPLPRALRRRGARTLYMLAVTSGANYLAAALASFMKVSTVEALSAPSPMSCSMFHQEVRA